MNEIVLRKLTINDVPELSTISKKTFYDSFSGTCTQPDMDDFLERYYNEKILTAEVQNEALNYYFAEVDGQTAGYILFAESSPNFTETINKKAIELKRLYVLNQFHGKSIAQKMMDFFLAYALNHTYDVAFLGV